VNGDPVSAPSAPVVRSIVNPLTVCTLGELFVTYANLPDGSTAIENGSINVPPAKGDPGTAVSAPDPGFTVNAEIVPPAASMAYKNFPEGSAVAVGGLEPAAKGDPATLVSPPVAAFMLYADTLLLPKFATYANFGV
jgi:hypothetical protein